MSREVLSRQPACPDREVSPRQCNCPVRRRAEEARKRQEAYDRAFAEIILLETKLDRAWERLLYEILSLEA